ncbi:hypothetical protein [Streptomyces yanii]|uniref:Uncharacterized protein n=1 Tax=Streptomyces yanii TaxID=78510 RepID=A0ABV5R7U4_9ACTN
MRTYLVATDSREVIRMQMAEQDGVPPGHLRLASPYDPDARCAAKGEDLFWCGVRSGG